jgi:hypothetical protein
MEGIFCKAGSYHSRELDRYEDRMSSCQCPIPLHVDDGAQQGRGQCRGDLLADELSNMKRERDRLAAELQQLEASTAPVDLEAEADAVVDKLWTLAEELQNAEPARLRELIRRMVARIDLWFDHVPKGNRVECPLSRGMIELRPGQVSYRLVSRGNWPSFEPLITAFPITPSGEPANHSVSWRSK